MIELKKKVLVLSIALMLAVTGVVSAASLWGKYKGYDIIKITVDGKAIKADVPAFVFDNRTMVPVYLLKQAGINYTFDAKKQTVDISTKSKHTSNFDPTTATNDIIKLGGAGVTIMPIDGDSTAYVYFEQNKGFDADWTNISTIFTKLLPFNSTYLRVEYGKNGEYLGTIEILAKDYKNFIDGVINAEAFDKLWILSGPMFSVSSNSQTTNNSSSSGTGTTKGAQPTNVCTELKAEHTLELASFDRTNPPSIIDGSTNYRRDMLIRGQEQELALYGCQ